MKLRSTGKYSLPSSWIWVILAALCIRIIYLVVYSQMPDWDHLTVDNYYHHNWAQNIADGNWLGDTTYFRAPLYPWALGILYALLGSSLWVGRIFGLAIGVISVGVTFKLGEKIGGRPVGIIAGLLHAFYPLAIYFESELLLDPLFTLLFELSILKLLHWIDDGCPRQAFGVGLLLGLAAITRPTVLALLPVIVLYWWLVKGRHTHRFGGIALVIIALIIPLSITFARNLAVAGDPVLVSSQGGINLYIGNNDQADGVTAKLPEPMGFNWRLGQIVKIAEDSTGRKLLPGEISSWWAGQATTWMLANPGTAVSLYFKKLYHFFGKTEYSNNRDLTRFINTMPILKWLPLPFWLLLGLSVLAIAAPVGTRKPLLLLALLILTYSLVSAVFFATSRFRLPLIPFFAVLSAAGVVSLWGKLRSRSSKSGIALMIAAATTASLFSLFAPFGLPRGQAVTDFVSRGLHSFHRGEMLSAIRLFHAGRRIDATFPEVNLNLGAAFIRTGQLDSAEFYLRKELVANPERWRAHTNLASIALLENSRPLAMTHIQKAVRIAPWDPTAARLYIRCLALNPTVTPDSLFIVSTTMANNTDNNPGLLNEAAAHLAEAGQYEYARDLLNRAVSSKPSPIETDDGAFEPGFLNSSRRRAITLANSHYQLGYTYAMTGNTERAIVHSYEAVRLDTLHFQAFANLVTGLRLLERFHEADSVQKIARSRFESTP